MSVYLAADTLVTDVFRDFSHRAASNDLATPEGSISSPLFGSPKPDSDVFENSVNSFDDSVVTPSENDSAVKDINVVEDGVSNADAQVTLNAENDDLMSGESTV